MRTKYLMLWLYISEKHVGPHLDIIYIMTYDAIPVDIISRGTKDDWKRIKRSLRICTHKSKYDSNYAQF